MKLILLSLVGVGLSEVDPEDELDPKYAESAGAIYPRDPRKLVFNWESQDTIKENTKWFDHVLENKDIEEFIVRMATTIPNTMMITPANAFGVVDNSPYCGAILTYDSENTELLPGFLVFLFPLFFSPTFLQCQNLFVDSEFIILKNGLSKIELWITFF